MKTIVLVLLLVVACAPSPAPPPPLVLSGTPCERACTNLRAAGCPEGDEVKGRTCETVCEENATLLNVSCIASVEPKPEKIRACGRVRCMK
jgi:hypothetical protein